jgi:hypothetical protein
MREIALAGLREEIPLSRNELIRLTALAGDFAFMQS